MPSWTDELTFAQQMCDLEILVTDIDLISDEMIAETSVVDCHGELGVLLRPVSCRSRLKMPIG
jgi:hypothetical protein